MEPCTVQLVITFPSDSLAASPAQPAGLMMQTTMLSTTHPSEVLISTSSQLANTIGTGLISLVVTHAAHATAPAAAPAGMGGTHHPTHTANARQIDLPNKATPNLTSVHTNSHRCHSRKSQLHCFPHCCRSHCLSALPEPPCGPRISSLQTPAALSSLPQAHSSPLHAAMARRWTAIALQPQA
jgi:hypothetical protein